MNRYGWTNKPLQLQKVTHADFFARIGPLDVNPLPYRSTLKDRRNMSIWVMRQADEIIGLSVSDSWGSGDYHYFLISAIQL